MRPSRNGPHGGGFVRIPGGQSSEPPVVVVRPIAMGSSGLLIRALPMEECRRLGFPRLAPTAAVQVADLPYVLGLVVLTS